MIPIHRGLITEDVYAELGEIGAGLKPGRDNADEITLFRSVGNAACEGNRLTRTEKCDILLLSQ